MGGLRRLQYRGYDSAGMAWHDGRGVRCVRSVGNLDPLQLLAYHAARGRDLNVDQPRNLATTVTVE